jgi:uncharacterized protein YjbI with pentapeptide repeats
MRDRNHYLKLLLSQLLFLVIIGSHCNARPESDSAIRKPLFVYVLDDDKGFSVIIDSGEYEIIVDGGSSRDGLANFLRAHDPPIIDGPIELVVLTNMRSSRFAGLDGLLDPKIGGAANGGKPIQVLEFWDPGYDPGNAAYREFLDIMKRAVPEGHFVRPIEQRYVPMTKSDTLNIFQIASIPEAKFTLLSGDSNPQRPSSMSYFVSEDPFLYERDNSSIAFIVEIAGYRVLFPGEIWTHAEFYTPPGVESKFLWNKLLNFELRHPGTLQADLLLVPTIATEESSRDLVKAVAPKFAILGAQRRGPIEGVIQRYEMMTRILSTEAHEEPWRDNVICSNVFPRLHFEASGHSETYISNGIGCGYENTVIDKTVPWDEGWYGRDNQGAVLSESRLKEILSSKRETATLLKGADLIGVRSVNLNHLDLTGTDLRWANLLNTSLSRTSLRNANLKHAWIDSTTDFEHADLTNVDLSSATLSKMRATTLVGANLRNADLSRADLESANLTGVDLSATTLPTTLSNVVLSNANLTGADLRNSRLIGVKLDNAVLTNADLTGAIFEPLPSFLPNTNEFVTANYLSTLSYENSPHALVELREGFKKAGLKQQQRQLTYSIERARNSRRENKIEYYFNYLLFDATVQYGMSPNRPLMILFCGIFVFAVPYGLALFKQAGGGIWAVWLSERVEDSKGKSSPVRVGADFGWFRFSTFRIVARWMRIAFISIYFSVISAFQIGYRDLNIGNWISRIQPREYVLRPTGWVRVVSGFQGLLSVYLLALWLLTYFGHPFD